LSAPNREPRLRQRLLKLLLLDEFFQNLSQEALFLAIVLAKHAIVSRDRLHDHPRLRPY